MGWLHCDPDPMFKVQPYTGPAVWSKLPPSLQVRTLAPHRGSRTEYTPLNRDLTMFAHPNQQHCPVARSEPSLQSQYRSKA